MRTVTIPGPGIERTPSRASRVLRAWVSGLAFLAAVTASALTVATYNVENYVVAGRMVDGVYRPAYPKPEKEKAALRRVIAAIAPDVLAVQEMGPPPYLEDFRRELERSGQPFPYAVLLEAADPDRHVAVLAKLPFREVRRHAGLPVAYRGIRDVVKRGVLEVTIAAEGGDFSLFVVHLKSRFTEHKEDPESESQRASEAEAVRDLVLARFPDPAAARFVICGDWNDTRASRPVRALQRRGATDLGTLLRAGDSRGETWTHCFRREDTYGRIDYFLVSAALMPFVAGGRAVVWDGPGVEEASDHRPVVMELNISPARP